MDQKTKDLMELMVAVETASPLKARIMNRVKSGWGHDKTFKYQEMLRRAVGRKEKKGDNA